jgi:hypothetical protein
VEGIGLRLLEVLIPISGSEAEEIHDNPIIIIAGNLTEIRTKMSPDKNSIPLLL